MGSGVVGRNFSVCIMRAGSGVELQSADLRSHWITDLARDLPLLVGGSAQCHKYGQKEAKLREEKDPHTGHQNTMPGETGQIWVLKEFTKKTEAESE